MQISQVRQPHVGNSTSSGEKKPTASELSAEDNNVSQHSTQFSPSDNNGESSQSDSIFDQLVKDSEALRHTVLTYSSEPTPEQPTVNLDGLSDTELNTAIDTLSIGDHDDVVLTGGGTLEKSIVPSIPPTAADVAATRTELAQQRARVDDLRAVGTPEATTHDSGFINVDNKRIAVEFNGYSGPGSSSGTGGSDDAYSPTSYSGPGSTFETGGSDNFSAATPGSAHSYFSPGSSIGIDAIAPTPPPEDENKDDGSSVAYSKTHDLLERETPTGGTTQAARADYVYNPLSSRFERQHDSNQFAQNENTMRFNGGTSDEFRYNNSESQARPSGNIQFGDSISTGGFDESEYQIARGDDQLGSSGEFNAGLSNTGTVGYTADRNGLEATLGYEGFYGVQAEAEVHGEYGIVGGKVSTEAQAGLLGSAELGLTIDSRNGVAGQVGVEFFAGAQVSLDVETEFGDSVDLAAGVDLKAGIGFEASADVEFGLDSIGVDGEIGAAIGVGADLNVNVSISPTGVIDDAGDIWNAIKDLYNR